MQMAFPDPAALLTPSSLHLLAVMIALTVLAFRSQARWRLRSWRHVLVVATAWCWLAATPVFVNGLAMRLESRYPPVAAVETLPENPVIIVLASGPAYEESLPDGLQLNLAAHRRTHAAVGLWQHTGGTLIFSGTTFHDETHAVSARMALLAVQLGVPREAIRLETRSRNTYENLRNTASMIGPGRKVIVVTSALHMPRAMAVAEALGMNAVAAPADFRAKRWMSWRAWLPDAGTREYLYMVLHEWFGLAWYELRGWT